MIPFTILFRGLLLKRWPKRIQLYGALLVILGSLICLIQVFADFKLGSFKVYWPLFFVLGQVPQVLMNIQQEDILIEFRTKNQREKFNANFMLALESFYQLLTLLICFWVDMIPGFGTSTDAKSWQLSLNEGFKCMAFQHSSSNCYFFLPIGIVLTIFFVIS